MHNGSRIILYEKNLKLESLFSDGFEEYMYALDPLDFNKEGWIFTSYGGRTHLDLVWDNIIRQVWTGTCCGAVYSQYIYQYPKNFTAGYTPKFIGNSGLLARGDSHRRLI
jgi:hypothetical protein